MGPVAEGTVCKNGSIGSVGEGDCTPVGALSCADDGGMFFLCGEGMFSFFIFMRLWRVVWGECLADVGIRWFGEYG